MVDFDAPSVHPTLRHLPSSLGHLDARRTRNQCPGVIAQQGVELSLHGEAPSRVRECSADRCWHWGGSGYRRVEVETVHWLPKTVLATGAHPMRIGDGDDGLRSRRTGAAASRATGRASLSTGASRGASGAGQDAAVAGRVAAGGGLVTGAASRAGRAVVAAASRAGVVADRLAALAGRVAAEASASGTRAVADTSETTGARSTRGGVHTLGKTSTCRHNSWTSWQRGIISIVQEIECVRVRRGGRHLGEREQSFIEDNVTRNNDPVGVKIETSVPFMIGGIS
jgi:hypothetical protein